MQIEGHREGHAFCNLLRVTVGAVWPFLEWDGLSRTCQCFCPFATLVQMLCGSFKNRKQAQGVGKGGKSKERQGKGGVIGLVSGGRKDKMSSLPCHLHLTK